MRITAGELRFHHRLAGLDRHQVADAVVVHRANAGMAAPKQAGFINANGSGQFLPEWIPEQRTGIVQPSGMTKSA